MKKNNNKKGFTIVELVIVIAVIAILAAVMIPTFGGIIETAEKSNVLQVATASYKEAYGVAISDGAIKTGSTIGTETVKAGEYTFVFTATNGSIDAITAVAITAPDSVSSDWEVTWNAGVIEVAKATSGT